MFADAEFNFSEEIIIDDFWFCEGIVEAIKNYGWSTIDKFGNLAYIIDAVFDSDPWLVKKFAEFISIKIDEANEATKEITGE